MSGDHPYARVEDPMQVCESLLNVVSFAIGTTYANLAGAGLIGRRDAADRLHLLAQLLSEVSVTVPEVADVMAVRLNAIADAIDHARPVGSC
jgi:hypothetical protein